MRHSLIRMTRSIRSPRWASVIACCLAAACSGENTAVNPAATGGTNAQGGANAQGGGAQGGGAQGGATASATGLGGSSASVPTGGKAATGGQTAISTGLGSGGAAPTGGKSSVSPTGGQSTSSTGGAAPTGGKSSVSPTGGQSTSSTGGATPTGGRTSTGGQSANPTGGAAPTGGRTSTGGQLSTGGKSTGGAGTGGSSGCVDTCPFANGITWQCKKRFFYGLNQAWVNFASDFGGGGTYGIAGNTSRIGTLFQNYSNNGASVIRWWVWPNFTGGGVAFTGNNATGLKGTTLADLEALMKLADQYNLYLQLTIFSFDNFKTAASPNLAAIATDATARAAIVANAVRPLARAAQASAYAKRVISWDVINEPEWAVSGAGVGGDGAFTPNTTCTTITQPQMATLLKDVVAGLRAESQALITIGNAAMKWKNAWMGVDQDFYTFHIYDWVQQYWPYNTSPSGYGVAAKPVVMGEFPPAGLNSGAISYATLMSSWYNNGYAGGLPWQDTSMVINFTNFKAFSNLHPCETRY